MIDLKALETLLERRLANDEAEQNLARSQTNQKFGEVIKRYREANPAAVSPRWGFA